MIAAGAITVVTLTAGAVYDNVPAWRTFYDGLVAAEMADGATFRNASIWVILKIIAAVIVLLGVAAVIFDRKVRAEEIAALKKDAPALAIAGIVALGVSAVLVIVFLLVKFVQWAWNF